MMRRWCVDSSRDRKGDGDGESSASRETEKSVDVTGRENGARNIRFMTGNGVVDDDLVCLRWALEECSMVRNET